MFIKYKIINHLTQKGKKAQSEKILNKSIKELQKSSKKQTNKLIQLSIILSSTILKIITIKNKKNKKQKDRVKPSFITSSKKRFSFAVKLIVTSAKENRTNCLYHKLKEEFFLISHMKSGTHQIKKDLETRALKEKHLLKYYRWN